MSNSSELWKMWILKGLGKQEKMLNISQIE